MSLSFLKKSIEKVAYSGLMENDYEVTALMQSFFDNVEEYHQKGGNQFALLSECFFEVESALKVGNHALVQYLYIFCMLVSLNYEELEDAKKYFLKAWKFVDAQSKDFHTATLLRSLSIATKNYDDEVLAELYFDFAEEITLSEDYELAEKLYMSSVKIARMIQNQDILRDNYLSLSKVKRLLGDDAEAIRYFEKALKANRNLESEEERDTAKHVRRSHEFDDISVESRLFNLVSKSKSLRLDKELSGYLEVIKELQDKGNPAKNAKVYLKQLEIAKKFDDKEKLIEAHSYLANHYDSDSEYEKALHHFVEAYELLYMIDSEQALFIYFKSRDLSRRLDHFSIQVKLMILRAKRLIATQSFSEAEALLKNALNLSLENKLHSGLGLIYEELFKSSLAMKKYLFAYKYFENYREYQHITSYFELFNLITNTIKIILKGYDVRQPDDLEAVLSFYFEYYLLQLQTEEPEKLAVVMKEMLKVLEHAERQDVSGFLILSFAYGALEQQIRQTYRADHDYFYHILIVAVLLRKGEIYDFELVEKYLVSLMKDAQQIKMSFVKQYIFQVFDWAVEDYNDEEKLDVYINASDFLEKNNYLNEALILLNRAKRFELNIFYIKKKIFQIKEKISTQQDN